METENFFIRNITCDQCRNTIEGALKKLGGVQEIDIDVETKSVTVTHFENISRGQIIAVLDKAGYIPDEGGGH